MFPIIFCRPQVLYLCWYEAIFRCEIAQEFHEIPFVPNRLGGMGIIGIMKESGFECETTANWPHAAMIVEQRQHLLPNEEEVQQLVDQVKSQRISRSKESANSLAENTQLISEIFVPGSRMLLRIG